MRLAKIITLRYAIRPYGWITALVPFYYVDIITFEVAVPLKSGSAVYRFACFLNFNASADPRHLTMPFIDAAVILLMFCDLLQINYVSFHDLSCMWYVASSAYLAEMKLVDGAGTRGSA